MSVGEAFGNMAEILAGLAPEKVAKLTASKEMAVRVEGLVQKKKQNQLSLDESLALVLAE